jgi:DNA processing protein
MDTVIINRGEDTYPAILEQLHRPPPQIYTRGGSLTELMKRPKVAIVGSRLISPYGRQVTRQLSRQLAEQGIVIVSGLALGVDAQAHEAALEAGGLTLAVLPSPVEQIAPVTNHWLGQRIIKSGGALISEYPVGSTNFKENFVARNQLVAALSDVLVITEAAEKSGSLHTARFALELGKNVLAIPGNITSRVSVGTRVALSQLLALETSCGP